MLASGQWSAAVRAYLASIHFVDRQIGRLIRALDASPHASMRVSFLLAIMVGTWEKNSTGANGRVERVNASSLIVVPPQGRFIGVMGSRCDEPVSLLDLYPTLLISASCPRLPGWTGNR